MAENENKSISKLEILIDYLQKGWRMSCDVDEATEGLENELRRR